MFSSDDFWAGLVAPFVLSAATLLVAWRLTKRRRGARESRSWAGPAAIGIGFVGGWLALFGGLSFPPGDAGDWLPWLAPLLAGLGTLDSYGRVVPQARVLAVAPLVVGLLAGPIVGTSRALHGNTAGVLAITIGALAGWTLALDALAVHVSAARMSAIWLASAAPASLTLLLSGSARLAQIGGLLAAAQAGSLAANLFLGPAAVARGTAPVAGMLYAGLLLCGHLYADLSTANALLLFIAPAMAWLVRAAPARFAPLHGTSAQLVLVLAVSLGAVLRAWLDF